MSTPLKKERRNDLPLAVQMAAAGEFALSRVPSLKGRVSEAEWKARVDLAAAYRLVARFGWDDMLSTHISARVPDEPDRFLINPYGVLFEQVTASSLVKVDASGQPYGETPFPLNPAAIVFHGTLLRARADVHSALHLHACAGTAVSMLEDGLLPLNQRALYLIPMLAYLDYGGLGTEAEEGEALARALGDKWLVIMRNHGTLATGRSVGQAFVYAYYLERACEYQLQALATGARLRTLPQEIIDLVPKQGKHIPRSGQLEWPALLATLDEVDSSFRN